MEKTDLTQFDAKPKALKLYIKYNGPHFNKELLDFATSKMYKRKGKEKIKIEPYSKEEVDKILEKYNIKLENDDTLLDYVYVANKAKADLNGSSIEDEKHLALYIKNNIDDIDGYDGMEFAHWCIDMRKKGIPVNWEEML